MKYEAARMFDECIANSTLQSLRSSCTGVAAPRPFYLVFTSRSFKGASLDLLLSQVSVTAITLNPVALVCIHLSYLQK